MRRFAVVGFAVSAGCAQLAGIDDTNNSGLVPGISASVQRMSIGTTVAFEALDLSGLQASYLIAKPGAPDDFTRFAATNAGGGTWTAKLPAPAPVVLTLPDFPSQLPRAFALPNSALSILYPVLEHPGRTPAPPDATLSVTAQLDVPSTAADSFQVYTVGSWTSQLLASGVVDATSVSLSYPFHRSVNLSGRPQFDRLTTDDAFLILRHTGAALTGVAEARPFDQNGADEVTATMTAVDADQTLELSIVPGVAARYQAVRPAVAGVTMNWRVIAAPGARIASTAGPVLHGGSLLPTDGGVTVQYANPFAAPPRSWTSMVMLETTAAREYMSPDMRSITVFAGMSQFAEASRGLTFRLEAGLPELVSINNQTLSTDGQKIARQSAFYVVTFVANPLANTLFALQVYDLVPSVNPMQLEYRFVFEATSTEPRFHIPPEILQDGHTYTLRAICISGGYPKINEGDLVTRQLPLSRSFLDSGVFTVTP